MDLHDDTALQPIGLVCRRTGLKPDLIRAWERRYKAVEPQRTGGRHRLYSEEDVERLRLLGALTDAGHSISRIAPLEDDQLRALVGELELDSETKPAPADGAGADADEHLRHCMEAIEALDRVRLEYELERAAVDLNRFHLLEKLLVPLMQRIGDRWLRGELRPIHEHMATATVRSFVGNLHNAYRAPGSAPHLIVTTPTGQLHELGALVAACAAAAEGWNVTYLGPDLPAEEIVAAARQRRARAILLSIVYPPDDAHVSSEIRRLARHLDAGIPIFVGGRAAAGYIAALEEAGALLTEDLGDLRRELAELRQGP